MARISVEETSFLFVSGEFLHKTWPMAMRRCRPKKKNDVFGDTLEVNSGGVQVDSMAL